MGNGNSSMYVKSDVEWEDQENKTMKDRGQGVDRRSTEQDEESRSVDLNYERTEQDEEESAFLKEDIKYSPHKQDRGVYSCVEIQDGDITRNVKKDWDATSTTTRQHEDISDSAVDDTHTADTLRNIYWDEVTEDTSVRENSRIVQPSEEAGSAVQDDSLGLHGHFQQDFHIQTQTFTWFPCEFFYGSGSARK